MLDRILTACDRLHDLRTGAREAAWVVVLYLRHAHGRGTKR